ncbi:peptide deformylase [Alphaproteobacteria bacterium]|nr:peptide deformylase [Alphaproteobacteria bacterium]
MRILTVLDPLLKQKSAPVEAFDAALAALERDMRATMRQAPGVGLAAVQVGVLKRLIVFESTDDDGNILASGTLVNPEIIEAAQEVKPYEEGCLSVPKIYIPIQRPAWVRVRYQDLTGAEHTQKYEGFSAVVVQHEMDHLNGVSITDHMTALRRDMTLRRLRKQARNEE